MRTGKSTHGGVLIAVDSSIPCKEITEFNVFEDVVGIVCLFCSVHLSVLSVYCPPENSPYRWASSKFTHLLQEIDKVQQQYYITEIIVTGDINFPLTHWNSFSSTSDYEDSIAGMFVNSDFEQILRKTTSGSPDICLLNNPGKVVRWFSNTFLIKSAFLKGHFRSDHDPFTIFFEMQTPSVKTTQSHAFPTQEWISTRSTSTSLKTPSLHTATAIATNFWKHGKSGCMKSCVQQFPYVLIIEAISQSGSHRQHLTSSEN